MAVKVDKEMFAEFWDARGSEYYASDEDVSYFLYEQMAEGNDQYLEMLYVPSLEPVSTVDLDDWSSVMNWVNNASVQIDVEWMDDDGQTMTPKEYFGSADQLLAKVLSAVADANYSGVSVWAVTVECDGQSLELIYNDAECWGLGHGDSVLVVEDLSEVTNHTGYFEYSGDAG